jgi:hypothetical protein
MSEMVAHLPMKAPARVLSGTAVKVAALLIAITAAVLSIWLKPALVSFWEFTKEDIVRLFTQLILISLFIERAIEVLLTPWRGTEADKLAAHVKHMKRGADGNAGGTVAVAAAEQQMLEYRGETRQLAFLMALAFGLTISAVGIRGLQFIAEPQAFSKLSAGQTAIFVVIDVILTGALLAGGADGLHKVVSVFTSFMDQTANRSKTGDS